MCEQSHRKRHDYGPLEVAWELVFPSTLCGLYFIEIGANCGTDNCSFHRDPYWSYMEKFSWRGAVIEANPETFARLEANYRPHYPRVRPIHVAVANRSGGYLDFYCPDVSSEMCTANTRWASSQGWTSDKHRRRVPTTTLALLWERLAPQRVDILGVDAEGAEEAILGSRLPLPLPRAVYFETTCFNNRECAGAKGSQALSRVRSRLLQQGYTLVTRGNSQPSLNDLWVRHKLAAELERTDRATPTESSWSNSTVRCRPFENYLNKA